MAITDELKIDLALKYPLHLRRNGDSGGASLTRTGPVAVATDYNSVYEIVRLQLWL
jgi:hypothetical protein